LITKVKPNINSAEVHPQLSSNGHPVDGALVHGGLSHHASSPNLHLLQVLENLLEVGTSILALAFINVVYCEYDGTDNSANRHVVPNYASTRG
jgi:hypothetical protein